VLSTLQGHRHQVASVAFTPDGQHFVSGGLDEHVKLWSALPATNGLISVLLPKDLTQLYNVNEHLVLSPDAQYLGTILTDNQFSIWNSRTLTESPRWRAPFQELRSIAVGPGGNLVALGSMDGVVKLFDPNNGRVRETILQATNRVHHLQFSDDGSQLAIATFDDWLIRVVDLQTKAVKSLRSPGDSYAHNLAFDESGKRLAAGYFDHLIAVFTLDGSRPPLVLEGHKQGVSGVCFVPKSNRLASCSSDGTLRLWDLASGREVGRATSQGVGLQTIAASPDGRRIVASSKGVNVWDTDSLQELLTLSELDDGWALRFDPRGENLVGASVGLLQVWRARGDQPISQVLNRFESK
jgi:WD40 repeat protein